MLIWPPADSLTTTKLGTVCPATKFRSEARGRLAPVGKTVRKLGAVGLVTVTLMITALAPVNGTPPLPATVRVVVAPAPSLPISPGPVRVSLMREGVRAVKDD